MYLSKLVQVELHNKNVFKAINKQLIVTWLFYYKITTISQLSGDAWT